jgi:Ca2+:H+ antiporter
VLKVSRGTSVVLLLVYILYLTFQLKTHAYMYESTPQEVIDEESHPGVLADMMNSSSSSDTSSSDSTDSDSSGSGSIATAGKRIKRVFKSATRRKSSTSTTPGSGEHSALSSPSTTDRQASNYWESHGHSKEASRRGSLGAIASGDEADADEDAPRVRDFVRQDTATAESSKSPERKKHRKKHRKRHQKKRATQEVDGADSSAQEVTILDQAPVQTPAKEVGFADEVQMDSNPAPGLTPVKSTLNMRSFPRPVMPKMFSQNVFVTPAPVPAPAPRPTNPTRSQSSGANLRRTSSLPDRLNRNPSQTPSRGQPSGFVMRSDPLPPFQHRARQALRKIRSEVTEDSDDEEDEEDQKPEMSRTAAVVLLLLSTGLVAACAEFMVDAIPEMIASSPTVSQAFIGLIILPIVGNAAEHVTAVTVAAKNKMDLAIGVAVGSSIQIALFVTPIVVLLGWILERDMSLYFNIFETISLFVTAFVVNFLVLDGRSNYLEGSLLIAAYVIIALGAFFYPDSSHQSTFGSVGGGQE